MKKKLMYAITLLVPGSGLMVLSHQNLQSLVFSTICSLFLAVPLIISVTDAIKERMPESRHEEETALGIGA